MKTTLLSIALLCISSLCWGITLRGTITLEGDLLQGASVLLVGTTHGTVSNLEGQFIIESAQESGKLAISFYGAISQIVDFNPEIPEITIDLSAQDILLDPVEIVAYHSIIIRDPLCGPCRHPCGLRALTYEGDPTFMSDPAVLNGRISQLSIARNADQIEARYQTAPTGSTPLLSLNNMPLDGKASNLLRFLWESNLQQTTVYDPNEAITRQGAQGIGGNLSFNTVSISPYQSDFTYQGVGGLSFPSGERQATFSHQEHHLRVQRAQADAKVKLRAGLDYVSLPNYSTPTDWQLISGNLSAGITHNNINWRSDLITAQMQTQNESEAIDQQQIGILYQQLSWQAHNRLNIRFEQLSQLSQQNDSLRQFHSLRSRADYFPQKLPKLRMQAQYDVLYSEEQQNHAFSAAAIYQLPKEVQLTGGIRQEHYSPQSEQTAPATNATTIRFGIGRAEDNCAPSRFALQYETAAILLNQNRVWFNSLNTSISLTENHAFRLEASLHANRFAERQAVDLCWLQWDGLGKQTQLGGSLSFSGHHNFSNPDFLFYTKTTYSYNQNFMDEWGLATASRSRSGPSEGHPTALRSNFPQPRGILSSIQRLNYRAFSLNLNAWGWLQNDPIPGLANGIRLQEAQLAWSPRPHLIHQKLKNVKCYLQGNNLLQWAETDQQDFDQLATRYSQDSFNPLALGKQVLVGIQVEL